MSIASGHGPNRRTSQTRGPDYSAAQSAEEVLSGKKQTPVEADYSHAAANAKQKCIECKYYLQRGKPESDCLKVIGLVQAGGICDLFSQRSPVTPSTTPVEAPKKKQVIDIKITLP